MLAWQYSEVHLTGNGSLGIDHMDTVVARVAANHTAVCEAGHAPVVIYRDSVRGFYLLVVFVPFDDWLWIDIESYLDFYSLALIYLPSVWQRGQHQAAQQTLMVRIALLLLWLRLSRQFILFVA